MTLIPTRTPDDDPLLSKFKELLPGQLSKREFAISKKRANGIQEVPVGFWKNATGLLHVLGLRVRFLFSKNEDFFNEIADQLKDNKLSLQDLKWFRNKTIVQLKNTVYLNEKQLDSAVSATRSPLTRVALAYLFLEDKSAIQPPKPKVQVVQDGVKVAKQEPTKSQIKYEEDRHIAGYAFKEISPDNNCFYNALAYCIAKDKKRPLTQAQMRVEVQKAVDEVLARENADQQKQNLKKLLALASSESMKISPIAMNGSIKIDERAIKAYRDRITENLFWGGLAELYAYCVVHNIEASVFDGAEHVANNIPAWEHDNPKIKSKNQIFLDYEGGNHFNAYIKD